MAKSVNHDQFKLFMTGSEWQSQITHSTDPSTSMSELWSRKEAQARMPVGSGVHGAGLYDSMSKKGYVVDRSAPPPTIVLEESPSGKEIRRFQGEGHHRVAAAAAVERDVGKPVYIPTNYVDNTPSGRRARRRG